MSKPGTVTYTAAVHADQATGKLECVVYRMVIGGVCGPDVFFNPATPNLVDLDAALADRGYVRVSDWAMDISEDGRMSLDATLAHL